MTFSLIIIKKNCTNRQIGQAKKERGGDKKRTGVKPCYLRVPLCKAGAPTCFCFRKCPLNLPKIKIQKVLVWSFKSFNKNSTQDWSTEYLQKKCFITPSWQSIPPLPSNLYPLSFFFLFFFLILITSIFLLKLMYNN
jgi:hypothetical protein